MECNSEAYETKETVLQGKYENTAIDNTKPGVTLNLPSQLKGA